MNIPMSAMSEERMFEANSKRKNMLMKPRINLQRADHFYVA